MTTTRQSPDGRQARPRIDRMKRSKDPLRRQCGLILGGFGDTLRTAGAFYLRFCRLAPMQVEALARHRRLDRDDDRRAVRRLCRFLAL